MDKLCVNILPVFLHTNSFMPLTLGLPWCTQLPVHTKSDKVSSSKIKHTNSHLFRKKIMLGPISESDEVCSLYMNFHIFVAKMCFNECRTHILFDRLGGVNCSWFTARCGQGEGTLV